MNFDICFTVTMRCNKYDQEYLTPEITSEKVDIEFKFREAECISFLMRFAPQAMKLGDYKLLFKYDASHNVEGISLFKDGYIYIVTNVNQVVNDVLKGYLYLKQMDKVIDIMEFDFNAGLEFNTEDEFEDEFK